MTTTGMIKTLPLLWYLIMKLFMKQGEIWLINLDPAMGAEIKKSRPAIIVNDDSMGKLPLKIIVPFENY
jgi:mRNA-degrading endonuclease toxin of MazEF toxin-antitoxin module